MKSVLLVAALLSSTAGAAFAELQSNPGLPGNFVLGADGQYYVYPNAAMVRAVPGTVIGPDAAGRYLNPRAPGGPQRQGRALTNTDDPLAVLALPLDGEGVLLDLVNPFSGDGIGSRGSVGRGFTGKTTAAPGRWLTDTAGGVGTLAATTFGGAGAAIGVAPAAAEAAGVVAMLGGEATAGALGAASEFLVPAGIATGLAGTLAFGLDALNPFSGDGFGSRGAVGRGFVVNGAGQQDGVPGRWITETIPGLISDIGAGTAGYILVGGGAGLPVGAGVAASLPVLAGIDAVNPWSGDGFGSKGVVGRGLQGYGPGEFPVNLGNGRALKNNGRLVSVLTTGVSTIDFINPWSGDGFAEEGSVGRSVELAGHVGLEAAGAALGVETAGIAVPVVVGLALGDWLNPWSGDGVGSEGGIVGRGIAATPQVVPNAAGQVIVPGRWLTGTAEGIISEIGAGTLGVASALELEALGEGFDIALFGGTAVGLGGLAGAAGTFAVDLVNPWSGDGFGSRGAAGRGLASPVGVAGQMPYYSTGNAGMVPVQYDVGPQGTTISFTIPNGYNVGQMGMMPMVPAMSAPQYRVIPQYVAPAPVAYAAPAMPANLAVAPAAANAGVKCQIGDQQAVALTVDACEEAGGLVQPMDAAQAAE